VILRLLSSALDGMMVKIDSVGLYICGQSDEPRWPPSRFYSSLSDDDAVTEW
jgi:hypothetical protein